MLALLVGCGPGDASTPAGSSGAPPSAPTIQELLARNPLTRDPTQTATAQEDAYLKANADPYLYGVANQAGVNGRYDARLSGLQASVGISATYNAAVLTDFRLGGIAYRGGITGHAVLLLDGKFLDILHEYATFLALSDVGAVLVTPEFALDVIIPMHNAVAGAVSDDLIYSAAIGDIFGVDVRPAAENYFRSLAGAILFHEFGHIYLWHMLDRLRAQYSFFPANNPFVAAAEDDADTISGMLAKKAGLSRSLIDDTYLVLDYYSLQQVQGSTRLADIVDPAHFDKAQAPYSSLRGRITRVQGAFDSFP
jgi:hypothetical protein